MVIWVYYYITLPTSIPSKLYFFISLIFQSIKVLRWAGSAAMVLKVKQPDQPPTESKTLAFFAWAALTNWGNWDWTCHYYYYQHDRKNKQ